MCSKVLCTKCVPYNEREKCCKVLAVEVKEQTHSAKQSVQSVVPHNEQEKCCKMLAVEVKEQSVVPHNEREEGATGWLDPLPVSSPANTFYKASSRTPPTK